MAEQQAQFKAMTEGTADDWQIIAGHMRPFMAALPGRIIDHLKLRNPIFKLTAAYGHFGRTEPSFTWEKTDKVDDLRAQLKL